MSEITCLLVFALCASIAQAEERPNILFISVDDLNDFPGFAGPYPAITGWKENSFAIQSERYRYIRYGDGSEELYDHEVDLKEIVNLADHPKFERVKEEMAATLSAVVKEE